MILSRPVSRQVSRPLLREYQPKDVKKDTQDHYSIRSFQFQASGWLRLTRPPNSLTEKVPLQCGDPAPYCPDCRIPSPGANRHYILVRSWAEADRDRIPDQVLIPQPSSTTLPAKEAVPTALAPQNNVEIGNRLAVLPQTRTF